MKAFLAVVFAAAGVAVATFIWLRWSVPAEVTAVPVRWEKSARRDIESVQFKTNTLEFLQVSEEALPRVAMIRRGDEAAELPDVSEFHFVREDGLNIWALAESTTEGPGASVLVLHSDDGVNFQAWDLKKPTYLGVVEAFEVQGDSVVVRLSVDQHMFLTDDWWSELTLQLPSPLRPLSASDTFSFRTRDRGNTWRLSR